MKSLTLINIYDAMDALDDLTASDIRRDGGTTLETFDNHRAKKALSKLNLYTDVVEPIRCKDCVYRKDIFVKDSRYEDGGFNHVFCKRMLDGYLGDDGFCSDGKRKERKDGRD